MFCIPPFVLPFMAYDCGIAMVEYTPAAPACLHLLVVSHCDYIQVVSHSLHFQVTRHSVQIISDKISQSEHTCKMVSVCTWILLAVLCITIIIGHVDGKS